MGRVITIRVCVAGATGKTGSEITRAILGSNEFELSGAIARSGLGQDVGENAGVR
jgi:4-hydroxy-tetrahydrodipicolinate reductase